MIGYHEALQDNTRRLYTHSDNPDLGNSPKTTCALSESRRRRKSADHQHGPWRWQDLPSAQLRWRALAFRTQPRILKALRRYGVLRAPFYFALLMHLLGAIKHGAGLWVHYSQRQFDLRMGKVANTLAIASMLVTTVDCCEGVGLLLTVLSAGCLQLSR